MIYQSWVIITAVRRTEGRRGNAPVPPPPEAVTSVAEEHAEVLAARLIRDALLFEASPALTAEIESAEISLVRAGLLRTQVSLVKLHIKAAVQTS